MKKYISLWRKRKKSRQNVRYNGQNNTNLSEMEVITTNLLDKEKQINIKLTDLSIKS